MKLTTLVGVALAAIATTAAGAPSEGPAVTAASSVFVDSADLAKRYDPPTWIGANCNPGWWTCDVTNTWSMYCNKDRNYIGFANCGKNNCKYGDKPGEAGCGGRHEAEAVAKRDANGPPTWIGANCNPGTWTCDVSNSWTMVCDAHRNYIGTSYCGAGYCKYTSQPSVTKCDCRKGAQADAVEKREAPADSTQCDPGSYICDGLNDWILVCGPNGNLQRSAFCGYGACVQGPNNVSYCDPRFNALIDTAVKRDDVFPPLDLPDDVKPTPCHPGSFTCSNNTKEILACGSDHAWHVSAVCANEGDCKEGPDGTVFCDPRSADVESAEKREDSVVAPCPPGTADCGDPPKCSCTSGQKKCDKGKLLVCKKCNWELEKNCGAPECCQNSPVFGSAFCRCRGRNKARAVLERSEDTQLDADKKRNCETGRTTCSPDRSMVWICDRSGQWVAKESCGFLGTCIPDGLFGMGARCI